MYPYMIIVPRLLDLIDWNYSLKKTRTDSKDLVKATGTLRKFKVGDSKDQISESPKPKNGKKTYPEMGHGFSVSSIVSQAVSTIKKAIKKKDTKTHPVKEKQSDDPDVLLVASIRDALRKVGEDPDKALPLLNNVLLPDIDLKNTLEEMRPESHTTLLARLIIGIIDKLTENRPVALFIDDIHW